jgi:hypothetical protein
MFDNKIITANIDAIIYFLLIKTIALYLYNSMSEIKLNKFEKEKRVIELYLEGKTIREIA